MHGHVSPLEGVAPRRLLIFDPAAFASADSRTIRQFVHRLEQVRHDTVFVLLGPRIPDGLVLPQPDYYILPGGAGILRHASGEAVPGWPPKSGKLAESAAVRHLSRALLVPRASVYAVVADGHAELLAAAAKAVAVGVEKAPASAIPVPPTGVNRALEELGVFVRPARRISDVCDEAFRRAIHSLRRNVTEKGFTAASVADNRLRDHDANYAAIWSRDGVVAGLWSLCLEDDGLRACFRATLQTLARHQSPSGQIPANVRIADDAPEYYGLGGIASIDAVLWFVIGLARYVAGTGDRDAADRLVGAADRAMQWLAAHDSNNDGLIEVPESSDWMDLFPRSYNVLYDEVLWYQACLDHAALLDALGRDGSGWRTHSATVRRRLLDVFWPSSRLLVATAISPSGAAPVGDGPYLLCDVTPFGYSWRCDVYANLLAALTELLDREKRERLFRFLWGVGVNAPYPVACLYPPVHSGADDWKDYFIVNFLNLPHHYHNGGIWPFIGGLWVRFLEQLGRTELAHRELAALAEACRSGLDQEWEFNEWLHGQTGRPMGKAHQAWSAASYLKAYMTLTKETELAAFEPLDPARFFG